tara:strand:- start:37 stop:408 length:372 start_codon:yes stop_codon:yes gene_type:complete
MDDRQRLEAIVDVVCKYLPPDGIHINDAMSEIISLVDPQPAQEPSATRPCRSCNGTGDRDTGIPESPIATCKPCNGTGQIALAQPAQEPVARVSGVYGGRFTYEPLNRAMILPVGMALYAGPA